MVPLSDRAGRGATGAMSSVVPTSFSRLSAISLATSSSLSALGAGAGAGGASSGMPAFSSASFYWASRSLASTASMPSRDTGAALPPLLASALWSMEMHLASASRTMESQVF